MTKTMSKLRYYSPLLGLLAVFMIYVCLRLFVSWWAGQENYVGFHVGLNLPAAEEWERSGSHGGWLGDGERLDVLRFSPENGAVVEWLIKSRGDLWNPGPFEEYLGEILYYGGPAKEAGWPRCPENAYWFFKDRQKNQEKPIDQRYSRNYTAALFDADTDTLYYMEFDT